MDLIEKAALQAKKKMLKDSAAAGQKDDSPFKAIGKGARSTAPVKPLDDDAELDMEMIAKTAVPDAIREGRTKSEVKAKSIFKDIDKDKLVYTRNRADLVAEREAERAKEQAEDEEKVAAKTAFKPLTKKADNIGGDQTAAAKPPVADQALKAEVEGGNADAAPEVDDLQLRPKVKKILPAKLTKRKYEEMDLLRLREAGFITPDMPPNLMSEEFRIIKRSLLLKAFSTGEDKIKYGNVLMVSSSQPNEGKTFCAINLALSIATEQDTTVLLIDADFSKPEVLNRLGVRGSKGIMDVVADPELSVADCLIRTNIDNLVIMPAGRQHNRTTELLASDRMKELVHELSTRYPDRLVIFDAPPALASSVPSVMSLYVGQIVFVIAAEATSETQIKESLNMLSACENINLLLNKTRVGSSHNKFATYYGYGGR